LHLPKLAQPDSIPKSVKFSSKLARQQLSGELLHDELALGYSVPEIAVRQNETMVAKADDDAFTQAMSNLRKTINMFAMLDLLVVKLVRSSSQYVPLERVQDRNNLVDFRLSHALGL
jgi:hypothetical protein